MEMKVRVVCEDGNVRHDLFDSVREADKWAAWGHFCIAKHEFVKVPVKPYVFKVNDESFEVVAESASAAMAKANERGLPDGFYAWMDAGPDAFAATFGAWD